jgi:hypothetical protein
MALDVATPPPLRIAHTLCQSLGVRKAHTADQREITMSATPAEIAAAEAAARAAFQAAQAQIARERETARWAAERAAANKAAAVAEAAARKKG